MPKTVWKQKKLDWGRIPFFNEFNELHLLVRSLCGTYHLRSKRTTSIVLSEAGCVLGVKSALFHSTHLRHPNPRWRKCFTRAITRTQRTESDLFHKPHLMTNLNVKIYLCSRLKRCCNGNSPHIEIIYFTRLLEHAFSMACWLFCRNPQISEKLCVISCRCWSDFMSSLCNRCQCDI